MTASEESSREELISLLAERDVRIAAQDAQIRALSRQVADLLETNEQLRVALARLEHLRTRNSRNSSMPPSQDDDPGRMPPAEKPNGRGRGSKRKKGKWMVPVPPTASSNTSRR